MRQTIGLTAAAVVAGLIAAPAHADGALPQSPIRTAAAGSMGSQRFEVTGGNNAVDIGAPHKAEFTSEVTLPRRTAGPRPLVVFLHGAHAPCYKNQKKADFEWPCKMGYRPLPSYQGYRYLADRLATQGFASLSISANGVNGQEDSFADGGTTARAQLVDEHLRAVVAAARGAANPYPRAVAQRMDLSRVLVIGHSRGAAGVALLAIQNRYLAAPYTVRGVMSLAGILQVKLGVPDLPFAAVLPQCDGDVFQLEGQNYVEVGSRLPGDGALRTAVWIPGANHNFLNTQWTPGLSKGPSVNDAAVYDTWAGPCRKTKRISSGQERRVARSYVAAMARLTLYGDPTMTQFLDGSPIRPGDVGPNKTRTTATTGQLLERRWQGRVRADGVTARAGLALASAQKYDWNDSQTPHWLPALKFPSVSSRQRALRIQWTKPGTALQRLSRDHDLSRSDRVQARVAVDTNTWKAGRVDLAVRDARGTTARVPVPASQLTQIGANLPGHLWAQSISVTTQRLRRAAPRLDLERIRWVGLSPRSGSGRVWMLDVWAVPRLVEVGDLETEVAAIEASGYSTWQDGAYRVRLRMRALASVKRKISVRYKLYGYNAGRIHASGVVEIPKGARSGSVEVKVQGVRDDRLVVATYPDRFAVNRQDYVWLPTRS